MRRLVDNVMAAMNTAAILITTVFLTFPILIAVFMSFDERRYLGKFPPQGFSLQWYEAFFSNDYYLRGLQTSVLLALTTTIISTTAGVAAAFALYSSPRRFSDALTSIFMMPLVVPGVVIGFALLLWSEAISIHSSWVRLLAGHILTTLPYTIRATLASLNGIRPSLVEAAMSLGANEQRAFWEIVFPLARTGMVAGSIFCFAFSMDDVAVSLFLSGVSAYTLPVALISMMRANFDLTIAAASVLLILMAAILMFTLDRAVGVERVIGKGIYRN